ncbi:hypothetical protein NEOLEDRAFT_392088 [Neolentinus lepideus HHB14362 ss-1]|uniref:Sodium/calcium exchanger membrane region domain-containing protein n=1 Tax=Neolentinus lepideus HHB14362 ss-1 TaxID=1314782 RepID=A0A165S790_9AGAM|nr:hypothetical protein NEOLEDRAFT_392088 [Neolentinus lepideus HHB14362 ss-1]
MVLLMFIEWNIFLVLVPISWWLHFSHPTRYKTIFACTFIAKFPLANLLVLAAESLSMHVGSVPRGILHSTAGNTIEFIIALVALIRCELQVVQTSLIGSIVNHLLLSVGMCFLWGGFTHYEQEFDIKAAEVDSWLLIASIMVVLFPAVLHGTVDPNLSDPSQRQNILSVSHGVALVLLCIYATFLIFMFFSHRLMYDSSSYELGEREHRPTSTDYEAQVQVRATPGTSHDPGQSTNNGHNDTSVDRGRPETPALNLPMATILLILVTAVCCALVKSHGQC